MGRGWWGSGGPGGGWLGGGGDQGVGGCVEVVGFPGGG